MSNYDKQLINISCKNLTGDIFKKNIFKGKIIIIKKSTEIFKILEITERFFEDFFNIRITNSKKTHMEYDDQTHLFFMILQNKIKHSKLIKKYFADFLLKIGLKIENIFMDYLTLRFSPGGGRRHVGTLVPTPAHRDTWASNIFNQINFWFPVHNVSYKNSIFLVPKYFDKKVNNNSDSWCFSSFKDKKNCLSTPVTNVSFDKEEILNIKLSKGEVLCFSGHHLHGSILGNHDRLNIETRTVSENDDKRFKIPNNFDAMGKIQKKKWFRNIVTDKKYS